MNLNLQPIWLTLFICILCGCGNSQVLNKINRQGSFESTGADGERSNSDDLTNAGTSEKIDLNTKENFIPDGNDEVEGGIFPGTESKKESSTAMYKAPNEKDTDSDSSTSASERDGKTELKGQTIECTNMKDGEVESRTRYLKTTVPYGAICIFEKQFRACKNGAIEHWSGKMEFEQCIVAKPKNCGTLAHGNTQNRIAYRQSSVSYGNSCEKELQTRTCLNGIFKEWSGSYANLSCTIAGPASCGSTPNKGRQTRLRYSSASVSYNLKCLPQTQTRSCSNGTFGPWSGSAAYKYTTCKVAQPRSCTSAKHNEIENRTRYFNSEVGFGTTCKSETQKRTCIDGSFDIWSGSYRFTTCKAKAPRPSIQEVGSARYVDGVPLEIPNFGTLYEGILLQGVFQKNYGSKEKYVSEIKSKLFEKGRYRPYYFGSSEIGYSSKYVALMNKASNGGSFIQLNPLKMTTSFYRRGTGQIIDVLPSGDDLFLTTHEGLAGGGGYRVRTQKIDLSKEDLPSKAIPVYILFERYPFESDEKIISPMSNVLFKNGLVMARTGKNFFYTVNRQTFASKKIELDSNIVSVGSVNSKIAVFTTNEAILYDVTDPVNPRQIVKKSRSGTLNMPKLINWNDRYLISMSNGYFKIFDTENDLSETMAYDLGRKVFDKYLITYKKLGDYIFTYSSGQVVWFKLVLK